MRLSWESRQLLRAPVRASSWVHVSCVHEALVQVGTIRCVTGSQCGQACKGASHLAFGDGVGACTGVVAGASLTRRLTVGLVVSCLSTSAPGHSGENGQDAPEFLPC